MWLEEEAVLDALLLVLQMVHRLRDLESDVGECFMWDYKVKFQLQLR